MRTDQVILGVVTATAVVASCAFYGQAQFVAIDREYAYVDGCTDVTVQGANLGETATGTIGGEPFLSLVPAGYDESLPEHAQDVGFKYFGVTPAAPGRAPGFYDVVITVDGEDLTLSEGFYYLACPEAVHADAVALDAAVAEVGGTVRLVGCSLAAGLTVRWLADADGSEVATSTLVSDCGTAKAHTVIPNLPDGTYWIEVVAPTGTFGGWCDPATQDTGAHDSGYVDPCASLVSFTLGAAPDARRLQGGAR